MGAIQSSINQAVKNVSNIIKSNQDASVEKIKIAQQRLDSRKKAINERLKGFKEKESQYKQNVYLGGEIIKDPKLLKLIQGEKNG